jgi:DNA adenine methylase
VEPFCGGLAVALGLGPARATLNDANPHVINFYRWLQRGLCIDLRMENDEALFYQHRDRFNALLERRQAETADAAALFYYLNRTGYNGLCRFNSRGGFNVPFGRYPSIGYTTDFTPYREAFADWTFTSGDVETVRLERGDFVYADPPYDVDFTYYATGGFSWSDQERTAAHLARHRGPVVLVNQATARVEELYRKLGYEVGFLEGPRRISCTGDRTPAREIIGTRNL